MEDMKNNNSVDPAVEDEEEVVFSGETDPVVVKVAHDSEEAAAEPEIKSEAEDDNGDDEVVFAETHTVQANKRHSTTKIKRAKPTHKAPFVIGSVALLCLAAAGIVFAMNYNSNTAPALVETSADPSQESIVSAAAKPEESSELSALPVIRTDPADIKTINTETIVFGENVSVSGVRLAGKTLSEAYDAMQNRLLELRDNISISITCDGKNITLTQDDFGFDTDLPDVLIQAYHFSRGELDKPTVETVYNDGRTDFKVTSVINKDSLNGAVKKVSDKFDIQPVDAHVSKFEPTKVEKFTYEDGSDGYLIDKKNVKTKIEEILLKPTKTGAFAIETVKTPFKITLADVKANTKLIASSRTTARNVWASVHNMELAIKTANGTIVKPGETFSFNTMTGDTTTGALGYVPSTAIVRGKYEQQYGGGICQAASTIYLCAMRADMEAVERHAHQYFSSYIDRGLDATVDYGNLDMRFKNTKDYPIYIATYVYDYTGDGLDELMVEMYGPLSAEYDEVVPVGWVTYKASQTYSATGAKVYFKNGKEIKREYLPSGTYDYHGDEYYVGDFIPSDPEFGPKNVTPTKQTPTVYSPGGCGSSAPVAYGTAEEYLKAAKAQSKPSSTTVSQISNVEDTSSKASQ